MSVVVSNRSAGGGFTGTAQHRIPFVGGSLALIDSADFTFDNSTKTLALGGTSPVLDLVGSIWRFKVRQSGGIINLESTVNDRWINITTAGSGLILLSAGGTERLRLGTDNLATWNDALNHVLGTATGTKWATAANQKQAWWGATPVVQQVLATGAGATVDNVITLLQTLGLCKQS